MGIWGNPRRLRGNCAVLADAHNISGARTGIYRVEAWCHTVVAAAGRFGRNCS
jgi:hypothetical protein